MNNGFSNLDAPMRVVPLRQTSAIHVDMEAAGAALGTWTSRFMATFLGTFIAGLLLLLIVHQYISYKVDQFQRNVGNALQQFNGDLKNFDVGMKKVK